MADICAAATNGDLTALQAYIAQGRDINSTHEGMTPLLCAAESGHLEVCRALVAQDATLYSEPDRLGHRLSALRAATEKGHVGVVASLLPHYTASQEIQTLERAISGGFYEIADLMLQSGMFRFPRDGTNALPRQSEALMIRHDSNSAFSKWQVFLAQRRDRLASLDPVYLEYGLVLAAKMGDEGRQTIKLLIEEAGVDINCRVCVEDTCWRPIYGHHVLQTPLCIAAAHGHMGVIDVLLGYLDINVALCGAYGWPPFLHLLRHPRSLSTPEGRSLLETLPSTPFVRRTEIHQSMKSGPFETVFENVLRSSDEMMMKKVIDLVRGAAGAAIAPLLVRTRDRDGLAWVFGHRSTTCRPSYRSWFLVCEYLRGNQDSQASALLVEVADTYTQWDMWSPAILMSLQTQNFGFAKQFFFQPWQDEAHDLVADTLGAFNKSASNDKLIEAWESSGHANATLWYAVTSGLWRQSREFGRAVSDARINPNMPEPETSSKRDSQPANINHRFIREARDPFTDEGPIQPPMVSPSRKGYLQELEALERSTARRQKREQISSQARQGKSLLTLGAEIGEVQLVQAVLRNPKVDVNIQDRLYHLTPLMYAVARGDGEMVALLVSRPEIRVNIIDNQGRSAIFYAAQGGSKAIVDLLIKTGKFILSFRDTKGRTALEYAEEMGHDEIVSLLQSRL